MEAIDWLVEIGGKRPTEDRLWNAWKRVLRRIWGAREAELKPQVTEWQANWRRRMDKPLPHYDSEPWFASWPGWDDIIGGRPDDPPLFQELVSRWQANNPELKIPRQSAGRATRFRVFERDGFKCRYCGRSAPDVELQADHVFPVFKGGSSDMSNLVTACFDCNMGKRDRVLEMTP